MVSLKKEYRKLELEQKNGRREEGFNQMEIKTTLSSNS